MGYGGHNGDYRDDEPPVRVIEHGRQCGVALINCKDKADHGRWVASFLKPNATSSAPAPDLSSHYRRADVPETWDLIEAWQSDWPVDIRYHLGNVTKYLSRLGRKKGANPEDDLAKIIDYAQRAQAVLQRAKSK